MLLYTKYLERFYVLILDFSKKCENGTTPRLKNNQKCNDKNKEG